MDYGAHRLPKMTLITLMASSILFLTGLSMTSIVTNMKVGRRGSYYIISRPLGMALEVPLNPSFNRAAYSHCHLRFRICHFPSRASPPILFGVFGSCNPCRSCHCSLFPIDFALKLSDFCVVINSYLCVFEKLFKYPRNHHPACLF